MSEDIKQEVAEAAKGSEEQKSEYTQEQTQEYITKLRKENEKLRKDLSAKLEAEQAEKQKALEEQGKYKELYEDLNKKVETFQSENAQLKELKNKIIDERKNELKEKFLPEKWETIKNLDLDIISNLAKFENDPLSKDKGKKTNGGYSSDFISKEEYLAKSEELKKNRDMKGLAELQTRMKKSMNNWS